MNIPRKERKRQDIDKILTQIDGKFRQRSVTIDLAQLRTNFDWELDPGLDPGSSLRS